VLEVWWPGNEICVVTRLANFSVKIKLWLVPDPRSSCLQTLEWMPPQNWTVLAPKSLVKSTTPTNVNLELILGKSYSKKFFPTCMLFCRGVPDKRSLLSHSNRLSPSSNLHLLFFNLWASSTTHARHLISVSSRMSYTWKLKQFEFKNIIKKNSSSYLNETLVCCY